jgi:hypothetical protein
MAETLSIDYAVNKAGEQVPLTLKEQDNQRKRDEWAQANPGEEVRPVFHIDNDSELTPSKEAKYTEDQVEEIEAARTEYFGEIPYRSDVEAARAQVADKVSKREQGIRESLGSDFADNVIDEQIHDETPKAKEEAITVILNRSYPLDPKAKPKDYEKQMAKRAKLESILQMSDEDYQEKVQKPWQAHEELQRPKEMNRLHDLAMEMDAGKNSVQERDRLASEMQQLEERYDGALDPLTKFPLDLTRDAATKLPEGTEVDEKGVPKNGEGWPIAMRLNMLKEAYAAEKNPDRKKALITQAYHDVKYRVGVVMDHEEDDKKNKVFTKEQIEQSTQDEQFMSNLKRFVTGSVDSDNALNDLAEWPNKQRAHESWSNRHENARNYMAHVAVGNALGRRMNSIGNRLKFGRKSAESAPDEELDRIRIDTDPSGVAARNAARAVRRPLDPANAGMYRNGVRAQINYARRLYQNEGGLGGGGHVNAFIRGVGNNLASGGSHLAEGVRNPNSRTRKMFGLGKGAVASAISPLREHMNNINQERKLKKEEEKTRPQSFA